MVYRPYALNVTLDTLNMSSVLSLNRRVVDRLGAAHPTFPKKLVERLQQHDKTVQAPQES